MQDNGFTVIKEDAQQMTEIRSKYLVPAELRSCHVAIVDGYIIEGHVPVAEIRLFSYLYAHSINNDLERLACN